MSGRNLSFFLILKNIYFLLFYLNLENKNLQKLQLLQIHIFREKVVVF